MRGMWAASCWTAKYSHCVRALCRSDSSCLLHYEFCVRIAINLELNWQIHHTLLYLLCMYEMQSQFGIVEEGHLKESLLYECANLLGSLLANLHPQMKQCPNYHFRKFEVKILNSFVNMTRNITLKIWLKFCCTSGSQALSTIEPYSLLSIIVVLKLTTKLTGYKTNKKSFQTRNHCLWYNLRLITVSCLFFLKSAAWLELSFSFTLLFIAPSSPAQ